MASTPHKDDTGIAEAALPILSSTELAHVAFRTLEGEMRSAADWFHWNGSEIVICSEGPTAWSALEASEVAISIGGGTEALEMIGSATADQVIGVAPEYRAAAVRYLGQAEGNAKSDALPANVTMHRLFVTPVRKPS